MMGHRQGGEVRRELNSVGGKVSPFPQSQHGLWCPHQAGSHGQKDKHEDTLNHFPLGSPLQSKWPDREAEVLIGHLV